MKKLKSPARIALLYLFFGVLWIALSDRVLEALYPDIGRFSLLQSLKGIVYVLVTALLVYFLVRSEMRKEWELKRELFDSLEEKNVLLREIHHRVKNNLQVISSLLSLQGGVSENTECRDCLVKSDLRVRSMALVHEHLYSPGSFNRVDMKAYIEDLVSMVSASMIAGDGVVRFRTEIQSLEVPLEKAVTCGLILNELIVNSLKHAFPGRTDCEIGIRMIRRGPLISATVSDNGVGMVPDPLHNGTGLGMTFVDSLVKQLSGRFVVSAVNGTTVSFHFPYNRRKAARKRVVPSA